MLIQKSTCVLRRPGMEKSVAAAARGAASSVVANSAIAATAAPPPPCTLLIRITVTRQEDYRRRRVPVKCGVDGRGRVDAHQPPPERPSGRIRRVSINGRAA